MTIDVAALLPLDYTSNEDWIYDNVPEWEGWEFPFPNYGCALCKEGNHELCQRSFHLACSCFQQDHEPGDKAEEDDEEEWEEF